MNTQEQAQDARLFWEAGDTLTLRAHAWGDAMWSRGLTYPAGEVIAGEPGSSGGWDVWDAADGESFYGFSVVAVRRKGEK